MNKPKDIGAPPGTIFYTGEQSGKVRIVLIEFNDQEFFEREFYDLVECLKYVRNDMVQWINVEGVHDVELVEHIGRLYDLHHLPLKT